MSIADFPMPPKIDPARLRPGRWWYVVAGVIAGLSILVPGTISQVLIQPMLEGPPLHSRFSPGQTVTVTLDPRDRPAIYAAEPSHADAIPQTRCSVTSNRGERIRVTGPTEEWSEDVDGTTWAWVRTIEAPAAGDYRVYCQGTGSAQPSSYAIGPADRPREVIGRIVPIVISVAGCFVGIGIAAAIATVTAHRRHRHRRRLVAEATAPTMR